MRLAAVDRPERKAAQVNKNKQNKNPFLGINSYQSDTDSTYELLNGAITRPFLHISTHEQDCVTNPQPAH